jgi:hypothetical protein
VLDSPGPPLARARPLLYDVAGPPAGRLGAWEDQEIRAGRLIGFLLCAPLALAPVSGFAADADTGPLALVIGNTAYSSLPPLRACTGSAHVVTAALRHAGFVVTEALDLSNGEMGAAINRFAAASAAAPTGSAVIYVCGYAVDLDGRDFLLPASARLERESDALSQGLPAKSLVDAVGRSGVRAGLVLLDAVVAPKSSAALHLDAVAASRPRTVSFAGVASAAPLPEGATGFAAAISAALATTTPPQVEAGALLQAISARLGGAALAVGAPTEPTWLVGGPAPATAPVPPTPAPTPAPSAAAPPGRPGAVTPAALPPEEEQMTEADRRRVQTALKRLGYYPGEIDGKFGADTRAAIRRYQHEIGVDMVGRLTPEQAGRLLADPGRNAPTR